MLDLSQTPSWLILLLPIVIWIFWLLFKVINHKKQPLHPSSECFRGLNYLLNDEQGKALDVFVKLVETNGEIIDTHFALGKIYRKNGEMDKAIKIHQGLIAKPSLPATYRSQLLLELGYDYLGAGWFDRAEGLFKEVLIQDKKSTKARHNLILIYQQEKDWYKAIEIAVELFQQKPDVIGPMIAHYYCELAEQAKTKGDVWQVKNDANKALKYDTNCVRATIVLAQLAKSTGDNKKAIKYYHHIEKQDVSSIFLVLDSMFQCYENLSETENLYHYLNQLQNRHQNLSLQNHIAKILSKLKSREQVQSYLLEKINTRPNIDSIKLLLNYKSLENKNDDFHLKLLSAIETMQKEVTEYCCKKCGFNSNTHYWLCPSCNTWGSVKNNTKTNSYCGDLLK